MCQLLVQEFKVLVLDGLSVLEPSLLRSKFDACHSVSILTENLTKINILQ
jgi:hypothetical protein